MSVEVKFDLGDLKAQIEAMGAKGTLIMARSLNRAITSGKTAMARAVSQNTGLQNKYVSREIQLDKASRYRLLASLTIRGSRIPLIAFQARGPEPSRGRGQGVSYRLPTGRGRVRTAFITSAGAHRGVFKRRGKARLPIVELRGPSLPHVFEKKVDAFSSAAQSSLLKNVVHELDFARAKETGGGTE